MESTTFDHITKLFSARRKRRSAIAGGLSLARISPILAARHSRRAALRGGAVGLAAATVAAPFARRLAAQDATPAATPEVTTSTDPHPNADAPAKTEMLFVQPFAGGAWAPKAGDDGVYTLTLTGAAANTVYFSDRPERISASRPRSGSWTDSGSRRPTRRTPPSSPGPPPARTRTSW